MTVRLRLSLLVLMPVIVSSQLEVQAMVGDTVLLPCVYTRSSLPQEVSVFWRGRDNSNVLDIRRNQEDLSNQNKMFTGRVSSQRERYRTGNFSILMTDVRKEDGGPYECSVPLVSFNQRVVLTVSARLGATRAPPSGGGSALTPDSLHKLLLLLSVVSTSFK